jgi:hypothetical protein
VAPPLARSLTPPAIVAVAIAVLGASLWPTGGAGAFVVALPFAVLAFALFAWAPIRRRHLRVDLHAAGIVVTKGPKSFAVVFEDVDEVWMVLDRRRPLPTVTIVLLVGLRLVLHDRSERLIPTSLQGADAIVRDVLLHCSQPLQASALEALRAGETLTFGRLRIDRTGLRGPSWTMRWADVTLVRRLSGRLSFFGWQRVFPRRTIWFDGVPHPTVFATLVTECASKTETYGGPGALLD